jgi:predicted esterase
MFRRWLEKGVAIVGVDVGESYGSPEGRKTYSALYQTLVGEYGLSPRACLLPQSRGGLMLYNWAAENPEKVACIAGIYTVCDLRSWPGLATAAPAYGLSESELAERLSQHNPVERLEPLARAKVPVLHIHGDRDTVVPLQKNAGELAHRYRALGGEVELLVVPEKGHQVCAEFFQRTEVVEFVQRHARSE